MSRGKNEHAQALAKLGAAKGGESRARALMSEERKEIARQAAEARWGGALPTATHSGELVIAGQSIACAVLEGGTRLLTQETFLQAIGRSRKAKAGTGSEQMASGLPPFLVANNLQPYISEELRQSATPVAFRSQRGGKGYGYNAKLLPLVCLVYLAARDEGRLLDSQKHIAAACDLLVRGFAHVGIIALVDEATGYQEERAKDELIRILEHYITAELMPWTKTFPNEFFQHIYRLQGWEYKEGTAKRTPQVGRLINKYIYEQLPTGVLAELQRLNPRVEGGYRRHKHFQFLTTNIGNPALERQISNVMLLMRISDDQRHFEDLFERAFPPKGYVQQRLPLVIDVDGTPQPVH